MLPDFPLIKNHFQKRFLKVIKKGIRSDPFLSQINVRFVHEGNILKTTTLDGYSDTTNFKEITSKFEIGFEEIIQKGPVAMFERAKNIIEEMSKQQSKDFFDKMNQVTERTGNVVDGKCKPLSPQLILKSLEKIAIDFDDIGNPILPTLVLHPQVFERMKKKLPEWKKDKEIDEKFKTIIQKKRKEWIDRESNRKLVD